MMRLKEKRRKRALIVHLRRVRRRGEEILEKAEKRRVHLEMKGAQEQEGTPREGGAHFLRCERCMGMRDCRLFVVVGTFD